jgi:hypothetical protein
VKKVLFLILLTAASAHAQTPTENVSVAPIECFWRQSATSVRVGEIFNVTLTCGVLETAATTVVPDQSRLDPDVIQLQPFEVVDGVVARDIRTASRRYFQYEYRVRYLGEEIGRDLTLPALTMTYRVQSRVEADAAAIESRERQYILPARPIHILSLLPQVVADIRETQPVTFEQMRATRFTASVLRIVAWVLFAVAGVIAVWALVRAVRRNRSKTRVLVRHASDAAVLRGVARELALVGRQRQSEGWTDALAARALAPLRIAASYELSRPVAQSPARDAAHATIPGQLRVPGRWPRRGVGVLLSGSATPALLAQERARAEARGHGRAARIGELEAALSRFASAAYGRDHASPDGAALDAALNDGERAVSSLRREHGWLVTRLRALTQAAAGLRSRAWAR